MKHLVSDEWIEAQILKNPNVRAFGNRLVVVKAKFNPCIAVFGAGPEGVTCKSCEHLRRKQMSKTYIKCDLRPNTSGPGTDHKAGWPACAKYIAYAKSETIRSKAGK